MCNVYINKYCNIRINHENLNEYKRNKNNNWR